MRVFTSLTVLCVFVVPVRADKVGPARTYKTPSANGKFVFVMIAPDPADVELRRYNQDHQKIVKAIRDLYPRSGLYRNDGSNQPLWTADWSHGAVAVASDGVHLVRFGPPASLEQKRSTPNRTVTANDLKQEGITVFASGKLLRQYAIGELVDDTKQLPMSVSHFLWIDKTRLNDAAQQFEIVTRDRNRVVIDLTTGKIVEKKKAE